MGYQNEEIAENTKNTNREMAAIEIHAPEMVPSLYSLGTAW